MSKSCFAIVFLIVAALNCLQPYGKIVTSTKGGICYSECNLFGQSYYWCYYITPEEYEKQQLLKANCSGTKCDKNLKVVGIGSDWDYCSPFINVSAYQHPCIGPCLPEKHWYWDHPTLYCDTANGPEECSVYNKETFAGRNAISTSGYMCLSPCYGYNDNMCQVEWAVNWVFNRYNDYCSQCEGYDLSGNKCADECSWDGSYYTCAVDGYYWKQYCGKFSTDYKCGSTEIKPIEFEAGLQIVGGHEARSGSWPWQVLIKRNEQQWCGGSIFSREWIVTAAHCFFDGYNKIDISSFTFLAGRHNITKKSENGQQISKARGVEIHENYNPELQDWDIALVRLAKPFKFNERINPICLTSAEPAANDKLYITGWGTMSNKKGATVLQQAIVPFINYEDCNRMYGPNLITDRMICAGYATGGIDACQGDSGGPAVGKNSLGKWELKGITSWGKGCGVPNFPGVYTNVYALRDWIGRFAKCS